MSAQSITPPFTIYQDIDGSPLEAGMIYIGTAGLNAVTNQITVYSDAALSVALSQPITTRGGYPVVSGAPVVIYTGASDFSIAVNNKHGSTVTTASNKTQLEATYYTGSLAGATQRTLESKLADVVSVKDFGATGDGVTDDTVAFTAAIASSHRVLVPDGTYMLTSQLTINPMLTQMIGDGGVTLNFSGAPASSTAILFQGAPTAGESITKNKSRHSGGFSLVGHSTITLIKLESDEGVDSAAITLRGVSFTTAAIGMDVGTNAWQSCLDGYGFEGCTIHINEQQDNPPTTTNFGERHLFINGIHSGTGTAYKSRNYNSDAHFIGVSFDVSRAIDITRGAVVTMRACHIEPSDTDTLFFIDGDTSGLAKTSLSISDSVLVMTGSDRTNTVFSVAENYSVGNGGLDIRGLTLVFAGAFASLKSLVVGSGKVTAQGLKCPFQFPPMTIAPSLNAVSDSGFESAAFASSDWTAIDGTGPPTFATDQVHSGTYSLKMETDGVKQVGAHISKKVKPGQNVFLSLWYKLNTVTQGAGAFNLFDIFIKFYDVNDNLLVINIEEYISGTVDWTYYTNNTVQSTVVPSGAERMELTVQLYAPAASSTAWVDDVTLNIID
tara:strand:- start:1502 stop:3331 length:1830 start_codon:yes stop_codon:yes gene_type:complete